VWAQDSDAGYQEALRRIEEARVSGATLLGLRNMGLTKLPPEIGQLTNLQWLDLSDNQLTALPPEIGRLTSLSVLIVNNNPLLTRLPLEFGQLTDFSQLSMNTLSFPSQEIQQRGVPSMLAYLRDYEAMQMRQTIAGIAAGVGAIAEVILAFRWRQRRGLGEKKKRM